MSGPAKEGARQCPTFKAIGTAPSINKTPVGDKTPPLPYVTFQDLSNSVAVVPNVMLNGKPAYVLEQSIQPTCQGDEPGTEKGVKSGTVSGYVKPQNASSTVTMMGMMSVRFGDPCVMNGGNNPGIYTTEEPAAANPAKSAAETSDPPIELETPEESSSVGEWLDETANDIGEWWEQTKTEMGEAVDHPWEGIKGGAKGILNVAPETGEMIIKTLTKQQANKFELVGTILNLLGGTESAQGANAVSQIINRASNSVNAPKFEMSNDAQAGGNNIVTGVTSVTGLVGIVKSIPKLFTKFGSKASKEADEVTQQATSPGDGVVVKPAKAEPKNGDAVQGGSVGPDKTYATGERDIPVDEYLKRENWATKQYDNIRLSDTDVSDISSNLDVPQFQAQRVKDHLFFNEHTFRDGNVGLFDADADIAESWQRLQQGTHTSDDLQLFKHEYFESRFEGIFRTDYGTAHDKTQLRYPSPLDNY